MCAGSASYRGGVELGVAQCETRAFYLFQTVSQLKVVDENSVIDSEDGKLNIAPPSLTGNKYVVKSGATFRVSCIFNGEDIADVNQLSWRNENDRKIDGESSSSLFTVALQERETRHKKLSLVFSRIATRDAGTYTCIAVDLARQTHKKEIHVVVVRKFWASSHRRFVKFVFRLAAAVLYEINESFNQCDCAAYCVSPIVWNEKGHIVGAMLGESLTVDCGASGDPQPEIEITDADGEPLKGL
ncbi:unnamed protein product [Toxocara canis]|uniref:Ig-like domain-containing protein n=1 Tax=Toxocara canis TaxID=6265 RepID=A0A183UV82_TOXCA|nr:unnamed protein product [Toxocara canis]